MPWNNEITYVLFILRPTYGTSHTEHGLSEVYWITDDLSEVGQSRTPMREPSQNRLLYNILHEHYFKFLTILHYFVEISPITPLFSTFFLDLNLSLNVENIEFLFKFIYYYRSSRFWTILIKRWRLYFFILF